MWKIVIITFVNSVEAFIVFEGSSRKVCIYSEQSRKFNNIFIIYIGKDF